MPRVKKAASATGGKMRAEVMNLPTALVASARNYSLPTGAAREKRLSKESWMKEAWAFYDTVGEYRYACAWVGNLVSKAILQVTLNGEVQEDGPGVEALAELFGGPDGQTEMLRQLGVHMTVAGDCYLISYTDGLGEEDWFIAAASEVAHVSERTWSVTGENYEDPLVIRVWRAHPVDRLKADAPSRAALPILSEVSGLTKHVAAQIDSRLASAGILIVPEEVTFPTAPSTQATADGEVTALTTNDVDEFVTVLIETARTAIANRGDASALVPIVIKVPGEYVDKVQHLTFWTGLDEKAIELRREAIGRLALSMDMPPEVLTGTADMNHWSSWQVEEAAIKMHTEPLLAVIMQALTVGFLRPSLTGLVPDERAYAISADTTKLRLRPNRSKEAIELYNLGLLGAAAVLRENGFEVEEKMDDQELTAFLTKKIAQGQTTPEQVAAAAAILGVKLPATEVADAPDDRPEQHDARPVVSIAEHPTRELPDTAEPLVAAGQVLVMQALSRAGSKIRGKRKFHGATQPWGEYLTVEPADFTSEFLLEGAWSLCAEVAPQHGMDAREFAARLDGYTRRLLRSKTAPKPDELREAILSDPVAA